MSRASGDHRGGALADQAMNTLVLCQSRYLPAGCCASSGEEQAFKKRRPTVILPSQGIPADCVSQSLGIMDLQPRADGE